MSTQEKLTWAKKNGVTPPDYVLVAAAQEAAEAKAARSLAATEEETHGCCASAAAKPSSCCAEAHAAKSCCSAAAEKKAARERGRVEWVLGIHAQKCHGIATQWIVCGAVLPPPPAVEVPVDSAPPLWWSDLIVCRWQAISQQPDVPPPQFS
jgi:hypothetical protein